MSHTPRLERGYVQVYTGNGKGKTTAAMGLALRAIGRGLCVYIGQFMKGQPTGELMALASHPEVTCQQYGDERLIRRDQVTQAHRDRATAGLDKARTAMLCGDYDLVIVDELCVTLWFGMLTLEDVLQFIDQRPEQVELVLTGRRAHEALIERADLVTEMREVKHYFTQGVLERVGVER